MYKINSVPNYNNVLLLKKSVCTHAYIDKLDVKEYKSSNDYRIKTSEWMGKQIEQSKQVHNR